MPRSSRTPGPPPAATARPSSQRSPAQHGRLARRLLRPGLILVMLILVADSLIGEKGLLERWSEVRRHDEVREALEAMREENRELREKARRLREEDLATIEDLARRQLGMVKPGELLFIVKDKNQPDTLPPAATSKPERPAGRR